MQVSVRNRPLQTEVETCTSIKNYFAHLIIHKNLGQDVFRFHKHKKVHIIKLHTYIQTFTDIHLNFSTPNLF